MVVRLLSLVLLICGIAFNDLCMLKCPCIPEMKLKCLVEFSCESFRSWTCFGGESLLLLQFISSYRFIKVIYILLLQFWNDMCL
jgi:hypothetical protein